MLPNLRTVLTGLDSIVVRVQPQTLSRGFVPPGEAGRVRERKLEDEQAPPAELTRRSASAHEKAPSMEKGSSS